MTQVALLKCTDKDEISEKIKQLAALLGGMERYVKPGDRVLIKPNVLCAQDASGGATTSPRLVKAAADLCLEAGAKQVTVGESSNWGIDSGGNRENRRGPYCTL